MIKSLDAVVIDMEIEGYTLKGPLTDVTKVPLDARGVYVVVDLVDGEPQQYLDIGVTRQLGNELKTHARKNCWEENASGEIAYCYKITSGTWDRDLDLNPLSEGFGGMRPERFGIEGELKWKLNFACGPNPWQEIERYWETYQEYEDEFGPRATVESE